MKALRAAGTLALVGAFVAGCGSGTKPAATRSAPPTKGQALLSRVHAAYRNVPAVRMRVRLGPERVRFTLLLRAGVTTAEEVVGAGPTGTTALVARKDGPTYARAPGSTCWRPVPHGQPQELADVGLPFPSGYQTRVKAPRRSGDAWLLPVVERARNSSQTQKVTLRINASTMLLESATTQSAGQTVTEHVQRLTGRPGLVTPKPIC